VAQSGLAYITHHVNDGWAGRWNESRITGILHAGGRRAAVLLFEHDLSENRYTLFRIML
jgi:hypothetical protein